MSKNNENKMFGKKKSKLSVLPIIFSSVLAAGALAGSGVSIWHVSKNYQESSEFKNTYNARINVDPVAYEEVKIGDQAKAKAEANLKESAKRLSAWLKYRGAESYDVTYELGQPDEKGSYSSAGWLTANYSVPKIKVKHITSEEEKDKKIENDPYLSYFSVNGFNTNNKTIVYRWFIENDSATAQATYTLLDFNSIFEIPENTTSKDNHSKTLTNKDGKPGVMYQIKPNSGLNAIYEDMKKAYKWSKEEDPETKKPIHTMQPFQQPRLYVINNIEQMFNEINYHLSNYIINSGGGQSTEYLEIYKDTPYQKFSELVSSKNAHKEDRPGGNVFRLGDAQIHDGKSTDVILNGEALNYLDISTPGTIEANSFLGNYVEKIYKYADNDYQKLFPDKITDTYSNGEPSKEGATVDLKYAWYELPSLDQANQYFGHLVNYGLKCKIVNIDVKTPTTAEATMAAIKAQVTSRQVPPKFIETIFGGNALIGTLSIGFLIFLVLLLIILAVLYRTTGVMSWICLMFMLSMTQLIALSGSMVISMSLLFGLFTLSLVGFLAALGICGRIKRRIKMNEDTSVAVQKGLAKALWPIVDISFITLMFGVCLTYICPSGMNALGVILITGGFANFVTMYLLNGLLMLLFFNNGLTMNKFIFLGRPNNKANELISQSNSQVPSTLDATKLEFSFYDRFCASKLSLINWRTLIVLCVFGAILIAGVILFGVNGWANSSLFHSGMCIYINDSNTQLVLDTMKLVNYSSYQHIGSEWYFYCDVVTDQAIIAQIQAALPSAQFGTVIGNTNKDILNFAMIAIIVGASVSAVYAGFRSNWTSFVPMLVGSIVVPVLILGIAAICQIKFDQNVIFGFVLAVVMNSIMSSTIISSINDTWYRKESYNKEELKFIVTASLKNDLGYIIWSAVVYALFIVMFALCGPAGLSQVTYLMIIGLVVTMVVTPITVGYLLYYFLIIRVHWLTKRATKAANKVIVNLDPIDEQSIEGINKFTKPKAYSKKPVEGVNK